MNKGPDIFKFKQFRVIQSDDVFKVGTDGVLLGAWLDLSDTETAVELGTGTGLISLIAAQRYPKVRITGLEKNVGAVDLSSRNFSRSAWNGRLSVKFADLSRPVWPIEEKVDQIFSNPPFFQKDLVPASGHTKSSKHAGSFTYKHLIFHAYKYLNQGGCLSLIYPFEQSDTLKEFAVSHGYKVTRYARIRSREDKPWHRFMIELKKVREQDIVAAVEEITLYERHAGEREMTQQFKELVGSLYINI